MAASTLQQRETGRLEVWPSHAQPDRLHLGVTPPGARLSASLVALLEEGRGHRDVSLGDGLLTISAVNKTVTYRLGPERHGSGLVRGRADRLARRLPPWPSARRR
jgi:hypothetical protein